MIPIVLSEDEDNITVQGSTDGLDETVAKALTSLHMVNVRSPRDDGTLNGFKVGYPRFSLTGENTQRSQSYLFRPTGYSEEGSNGSTKTIIHAELFEPNYINRLEGLIGATQGILKKKLVNIHNSDTPLSTLKKLRLEYIHDVVNPILQCIQTFKLDELEGYQISGYKAKVKNLGEEYGNILVDLDAAICFMEEVMKFSKIEEKDIFKTSFPARFDGVLNAKSGKINEIVFARHSEKTAQIGPQNMEIAPLFIEYSDPDKQTYAFQNALVSMKGKIKITRFDKEGAIYCTRTDAGEKEIKGYTGQLERRLASCSKNLDEVKELLQYAKGVFDYAVSENIPSKSALSIYSSVLEKIAMKCNDNEEMKNLLNQEQDIFDYLKKQKIDSKDIMLTYISVLTTVAEQCNDIEEMKDLRKHAEDYFDYIKTEKKNSGEVMAWGKRACNYIADLQSWLKLRTSHPNDVLITITTEKDIDQMLEDCYQPDDKKAFFKDYFMGLDNLRTLSYDDMGNQRAAILFHAQPRKKEDGFRYVVPVFTADSEGVYEKMIGALVPKLLEMSKVDLASTLGIGNFKPSDKFCLVPKTKLPKSIAGIKYIAEFTNSLREGTAPGYILDIK